VYIYPPDAATILVPVLSEVEAYQLAVPIDVLAIHVTPESAEVYKYSPVAPATIFVPVLSAVKVYQLRGPTDALSTHVAPESAEVYKCPPPGCTPATIFVHVLSHANDLQLRDPEDVLSTQVDPESVDVYIYSWYAAATMLVAVAPDFAITQIRDGDDATAGPLGINPAGTMMQALAPAAE
jgi:hypothetical protein